MTGFQTTWVVGFEKVTLPTCLAMLTSRSVIELSCDVVASRCCGEFYHDMESIWRRLLKAIYSRHVVKGRSTYHFLLWLVKIPNENVVAADGGEHIFVSRVAFDQLDVLDKAKLLHLLFANALVFLARQL